MSKYRATFQFEARTPDGQGVSTDVVGVVFPAPDGQYGVLGNHGPLISLLGRGLMRVDAVDGSSKEYFVANGFAHIHDNEMTVLAEDLADLDKIDPERAYEELEQARRLPEETDSEAAWKQMQVATAEMRFNLVQKRRRHREGARSPSPDLADVME